MESIQLNEESGRKTFSVLQGSVSSEDNAQLFAEFLENLSGEVERVVPVADKFFHDFAHLKRGETIMGCKTQDEWAQRYAKRTARALRYLFKGGNAQQMRERRAADRVLPRAVEPPQINLPPSHEPEEVPIKVSTVELPSPRVQEQLYNAPGRILSGPTPEESQLQKLRADLQAERNLIREFKRLVEVGIGESGRSYLSQEMKDLYDKLMGYR